MISTVTVLVTRSRIHICSNAWLSWAVHLLSLLLTAGIGIHPLTPGYAVEQQALELSPNRSNLEFSERVRLETQLLQPTKSLNLTLLLLLTIPLDLTRLELDALPTDGSVLTSSTISQSGLTVPSLWWIKEQITNQFGRRSIDNWIAYRRNDDALRRVDLIVNSQIWSLLDYVKRYTLVHQFGTVARDYGYNIRFFNRQGSFLGIYFCDFNQISGSESAVTTPSSQTQFIEVNKSQIRALPTCEICLLTSEQCDWRIQFKPIDEFQSKGGSTD
ncbi:MAG: hypothetical protein F6K19_23650 [Cyanothece sp. SIO1E1]|nr:hypothetical protein [Cyanothece sp. SIO1E1]